MPEKLPDVAKTEDQREEELAQKFKAANEDRDFSIYNRSLDAALEAKAESLFLHLLIEEGDIVVDAGSGTGKLAELVAREFRGARVVMVDISHELYEEARENQAVTTIVFGDAAAKIFPDNSIKIKYFWTSGHEIESFGGSGRMRMAAENTFSELVPGGRIVIRDFAKPEIWQPIYMKIKSKVGIDEVSFHVLPEDIDYSSLSTLALLERFQKEFAQGGAFTYEKVLIAGEEYALIDSEWVHEFYLRKDYTANWRQEIKEKYTYWTMVDAKRILEEVGYVNVEVSPDPNEYILKNRLEGKIALFVMEAGRLKPIPFPTTHMVVRGEKPGSGLPNLSAPKDEKRGSGNTFFAEAPISADYKRTFETIRRQKESGNVQIGDRIFEVEGEPLVGTKKYIYKLRGDPPRVLKVVRPDTRNDHNVFKSMLQIIDRQRILDKLDTPHLRILESDPEGPPYRYVIQEALPPEAECMADRIRRGGLSEEEIKSVASIVSTYEKSKMWQLDMNPLGWFRIPKPNGKFVITYVAGKVYRYDEQWEFKKIGLLQWIDPEYIQKAENFSAAIPKRKEYEEFLNVWRNNERHLLWWKKYLQTPVAP